MSAPEELVFRTEVQSGKSVKETDKLTKSIEKTDKAVKGVGKTTEKTAKDMKKGLNDIINSGDSFEKKLAAINKVVKETPVSIRDMNKQIQAYQSIALEAGRTSPIGQEALAQAAALKDQYVDIQNETKRLSDDQKNLKGVMEIGSSVLAGYGALQGAMALTGNTSEEMRVVMVKLQAVQTILISLDKIRTALQKESSAMLLLNTVRTKAATVAQVIYTTVVGTTTGALKALRIAFLAIPIVAIIAGIMALVSALAWFFSAAEEAEEMNNKVNESFEKQNKLLETNTRNFKRNADNKRAIMESENATAEELFEFDKKRILDEEKLRKDEVAMYKEILPQKTAAYKQALEEENWELAKTIREETTQMRDKYHKLIELQDQWVVDTKVLENKRKNELAKIREQEAKEEERELKDKQKKAQEWAKRRERARQEEAKRVLEEQRTLQDLLNANIQDEDLRRTAQLKTTHAREIEELIQRYGAEHEIVKQATIRQIDERAALMDEFRLREQQEQEKADAKEAELKAAKAEQEAIDERARLEGKLIMMREDFEATQALKKELALIDMEEALAQEELTEGEKFRIREEYAQKIDDINEENAQREKNRQKSVMDTTVGAITQGLDAAQGLSDAFFDYKLQKAKGDEKETLRLEKKKFETNKKLQIAQAVIQGIQGVMAAYSSGSAIPVVGAVTGPAFALAAGITSALNIAKIANTKFEGGNRSGGGAATASTPAVDIPSVSGQTPEDITTLTQGLQGGDEEAPMTTKVTLLKSELEESLAEGDSEVVISNVG